MHVSGTVGNSVPRLEGVLKVTGRAHFGADENCARHALVRVRAEPRAARADREIDVSQAQAAARRPGHPRPAGHSSNGFGAAGCRTSRCWRVDRVRFIGEKVVAIAAETPRRTRGRAAGSGRLTKNYRPCSMPSRAPWGGADPRAGARYEDAPASWGKAPNVQSWVTLSHGDVERGFGEADHVIEHVPGRKPCTRATSSRTQYVARAGRQRRRPEFRRRTRCPSGRRSCWRRCSTFRLSGRFSSDVYRR